MTPLSLLLAAALALPAAAANKPAPQAKKTATAPAAKTSPSPKDVRPGGSAEPAAASPLPLYPPTTGEITVDAVVARFERFDRDMRALSAGFRQSVHSADTGQTQSLEGRFDYRKKDLMRIEHIRPDKQTLVCDGAKVWVWRPADGQVIRSRLADWKLSQPLAQGLLDFGNYADLLKRYEVSIGTVSSADPEGHRTIALRLKPKPAPAGKASPQGGALSGSEGSDFILTLRLSTRDYFPAESELRVGAVSARTVFEGIRFNPDLPESLFTFTPPLGADILDFPAPAR
ncbi:MAG: outer membrane lipoprotein carrier protein LolA [Elusimicrobiota bacterium]|jgi:outer membrane lipoprotein-sorting protein